MTRLALVLIAIVVLALSAGVSHTQLPSPNSPAATSLQVLEPHQVLSGEFDFAPQGQLPRTPALRMGEDAPEPALIVYLALVLIGSVVAVGIVRRSERSRD
jgi:hypothetical protein